MKKSILVTTTNSIEGAEILNYIDLISTNVVIGTNFFSDFSTSFNDLFGGYSDSYQKKLQGIHKVSIDKLKQQAIAIGANAIIGLKIDFDEISGKGKSMFMVSAIGMAVSLNYKEDKIKNNNDNSLDFIASEELEKELIKIEIKKNILSKKLPNNEQWVYLLNNPIDDIIKILIDYYTRIYNKDKILLDNNHILLINNMSAYLAICNSEIVTDNLYSCLIGNFDSIFPFIETLKLFSVKHISVLIEEGYLDEAVSCLNTHKSFYSHDDIVNMNQLITIFNSLPDKGRIDTVKGLLSKAKEKYICQHGHINDAEEKFCSNLECRRNIKGLTIEQINLIEYFKEKVETLSLLLSK